MTSSPRREIDEGRLDEQYVQDAFHSYLKSSLAHAKAERLLDVKVLSSAEGDLMITGTFIWTWSCARMLKDYDTFHRLSNCHRTRIMSLFRCTTFHLEPSFSPSSPPRHQSEGEARIVPSTRHDPPLAHELSRSLHPLPPSLVLLRPHDPKPRTGIPTRSRSHHLRAPAPRAAFTSRFEPPRRGLAVHID